MKFGLSLLGLGLITTITSLAVEVARPAGLFGLLAIASGVAVIERRQV